MDKRTLMTTAWTIARDGAARFGGSVRSYIALALKAAWARIKDVIDMSTETTVRVLHTISGEIRGGGSGSGAWVARITGPDPKWKLAREFVERAGHVSRSGRSGSFTWEITEPGFYELRGVQYAAGIASIGTLDSGFIKVGADGTVERVSKAAVIAAVS